MKYLKRRACLAWLVIFALWGCTTGNGNQPKGIALPPIRAIDVSEISTENGFLNFKSFDSFEKYFKLLEANLEEYDDKFLLKMKGKSDDEIEFWEEKLKYDPERPLFLFEAQLKGYQSLRRKVRKEEEAWLSSKETLDWEKDPDNHIVDHEVLRSLLNEQGEIAIDGKIFKIFPNGVTYAILDGDVKTLKMIQPENGQKVFEAPNVIINDVQLLNREAQRPFPCAFFKRSVAYETFGNRRIKSITGISNFIFYSQHYSKSCNYLKKRGKWKKRRAKIKCSISNEASEVCDPNFGSFINPQWSPPFKMAHSGFKKRRCRAIRSSTFGLHIKIPSTIPASPTPDFIRVAEKGKLVGKNNVEGHVKTLPLTWK